MEREGTDKAGPDFNTGAAKSNGRFTSPLVINSASRRRSLFSRPRVREDATRPSSSGSASDSNVASPSNTRIPRPAQRRPFTLSDAYRLAEEEEAAQGSPSPAPRLWRSRRGSAEKKTTKSRSPSTLDTLRLRGVGGKSGDLGPGDSHDERPVSSQQSDHSDTTFDEKLRQYALDQKNPEEPGRRSNGLFSRSRLGTRIVETGKELLVRKSSRASLENSSSPRAAKVTTSGPSLLRRLSGRRPESSGASSARELADWAQPDDNAHGESPHSSTTPLGRTGTGFPGSQTPNRSFAWQADADFTAGELQISNSPPVGVGRSNTRIDEIRALEAEVDGRFSGNPLHQPKDTQNENLRALEADDARKSTDEPLESDKAVSDTPEGSPEGGNKILNHRPVSRASMRVDELRSREIESLSRRALATARLDEFRGRNIGTSRSPSPDITRKPSNERVRSSPPLRDRLRRQEDETPATTVQAEEGQLGQDLPTPGHLIHSHSANVTQDADCSGPESKDEPADVLPRLATVTGSNPAPETRVVSDSQVPAARGRGLAERARQRRSIGGAKSDARPTVGFAGLSRSSSVESRVAKRTSLVQSDSDPTERIEGEMKLFAPQENQSERGSLRAPSPKPDEEVPEETPKPTKIDPLTQPTPRVTGAFIETPATVKVEKLGEPPANPAPGNKNAESQSHGPACLSADSMGNSETSLAQSVKDGVTARQQKRTQSSRGDRVTGHSSSLSARRRARSFSRGRTPLTNSARPPTVRDDLLEIQRANQIDDSTLDDIADLFIHQDHLGAALGSKGIKSETGNNVKLDREKELEAYDRMSRSLETGLLGIRSAKQGIQRLEDKVAHADIKEHLQQTVQHTVHGDNNKGESSSCPACHSAQSPADAAMTYLHLPLPRLWHRRPNFRFTLLGLSLFLFSLWYIAESWVCFRYCKPDYCYPGTPCDWSADDPVWGNAIPVKLDQWVAGGQGRDITRRLRPELADWLADLRDKITGTDLTAVDTSRYSWEQKRQHRRRLAKMGLSNHFVERPEDRAIFSGWKSVRMANERARLAQEMGYEVEQHESIGGDERL